YLWRRTVYEGEPKIQRHPKSSHASSTAATDGERVAALFGSEGLYVYDLDGELLWKKDLGVLHAGSYRTADAQWGYGSSPVFHGGMLVIQADLFKGGFVVVFDAATGREIWRAERDDHPTWSTPTVYSRGSRDLVVVNGYKHKAAYELASGQEVWRMSGGGDIPVPTPVVAHDLVFLTSAHGGSSPVYAIKTDARGDISLEGDATSNAGVAWSVPRGGSYMQTPIVVGDELYVCRDNGVLSCYDARSGKRHYQERLASSEGFTASPVSAGDEIYFTGETGRTHVIKAGTSFERLAINELGESVMATPAIVGDTIYIRGRHHVVAIQKTVQDSTIPGTR
ncbi:MAG: PQQ-binding-like beta-propeller repeat protein, partial [Acidobacteriota bacterium]